MSNCQDFGRSGNQQAASVAAVQQEPIMYVAPGEPVPPGFEGEVEKVCEIQVRGFNFFFFFTSQQLPSCLFV